MLMQECPANSGAYRLVRHCILMQFVCNNALHIPRMQLANFAVFPSFCVARSLPHRVCAIGKGLAQAEAEDFFVHRSVDKFKCNSPRICARCRCHSAAKSGRTCVCASLNLAARCHAFHWRVALVSLMRVHRIRDSPHPPLTARSIIRPLAHISPSFHPLAHPPTSLIPSARFLLRTQKRAGTARCGSGASRATVSYSFPSFDEK